MEVLRVASRARLERFAGHAWSLASTYPDFLWIVAMTDSRWRARHLEGARRLAVVEHTAIRLPYSEAGCPGDSVPCDHQGPRVVGRQRRSVRDEDFNRCRGRRRRLREESRWPAKTPRIRRCRKPRRRGGDDNGSLEDQHLRARLHGNDSRVPAPKGHESSRSRRQGSESRSHWFP